MVILKQGSFFMHQGKNKWSEVWMILSHELEGPSVVLYKDSHAKKAVEEIKNVTTIADQIRFGTTTIPVGAQPEPVKDVRIHSSCFVAIPVEKTVKKQKQMQTLWLCAPSSMEMFKLIRLLSACLMNIQFPAPGPNSFEDIHALHRYRPSGFEADNDWEIFWDNPSRPGSTELESIKQSGMAMSVDHLNEKRTTMKDLKNKNANKNGMKQYQSASALNEMREEKRGSVLSLVSSEKRSPNYRLRAETCDVLVDETRPLRVEELCRSRELRDETPASRRKPTPRSRSSSAATTPLSIRSQKRSPPEPLYVMVPKETEPAYESSDEEEPVTPKAILVPREPPHSRCHSRYSTSDYSSQSDGNGRKYEVPPEDTVVLVHHPRTKREAHYEIPNEDEELPVVVHHHRHIGTPPRKQSTYRTPRESPRISPKAKSKIHIERRISDLSYVPYKPVPLPKRRFGKYVNAEVQTETIHPECKTPLIDQRNPALDGPESTDEEELQKSVEQLRTAARDNLSLSDWSENDERPVKVPASPQLSMKSLRSSYSSEYRFYQITESKPRSGDEGRIYEIEVTRH
ncbi:hypothetical protein L596_027773 [Steinernema carpocapsae]|uniref:PH domain-containing protein n=1 Tax=Steinernema carpocapsae TaxID=34508 RepID=A0A4U5LWI6_STECR|nr:hypothetical protein L596_027773 [Steinernema carpocapsae]